MIKNIFSKDERRYRDVKIPKVCKQGCDGIYTNTGG